MISFLVLVGSGYGWAADRTLESSVTHVAGLAPGAPNTDGPALNVLLVGDDHRPAGASQQLLDQLRTQQDGGSINTDTMMVLHVPADGTQATVVSFPRDSWVDIPGHGKNKLNSAFAYGSAEGGGDAGGMRLLIQTIQQLTGLSIDHFVRVSLLGFYQIAQVLGPVQVCLNHAAKDPYSGIDLPAGVSTLNASQLLSFVRQRHGVPRGDLGREVRQQYFLSVELRKVISGGVLLNPGTLSHLLGTIGSAVQTDPGLDLLQFASRFPHLSASAVRFSTIPTTGTPTIRDDNGNNVSIVAVDSVALPAFIAAVIGEPSAYRDAKAAAPGTVTVNVVNGTSTPRLAAATATALKELGFSATASTTSETTTLTTVTYPTGMEAEAKAVAAAVLGASAAASDTVRQVTLTLGSDGRRVPTPTGTAATPSQASTTPATSAPGATTTAPSSGLTRSFSGSACID